MASVTETMSKPPDLVQGTLDLLLLTIIALEPVHGWAISQRLKQMSDDALQVSDGSLYPALHKLEQEGLVGSYEEVEKGRTRRYYRITKSGRGALATDRAEWLKVSRAVTLLLREA